MNEGGMKRIKLGGGKKIWGGSAGREEQIKDHLRGGMETSYNRSFIKYNIYAMI